MKINFIGYNIAEVIISAAITAGTKTEIGTSADYKALQETAKRSGIFKVKATIGGTPMQGVCNANEVTDAFIDFGTVTNMGGTPSAVAGTVTNEGGKMYVTLTITAI